jgi:hypothetical protein
MISTSAEGAGHGCRPCCVPSRAARLTACRPGTTFGDALGDQLVEVIGLAGGELAHREVVQDQQIGFDVYGQAFIEGAIGVTTGEIGQDAAGLVEADLGAGADGQVPHGLSDVGLPDTDGAVEDDRFSGL